MLKFAFFIAQLSLFLVCFFLYYPAVLLIFLSIIFYAVIQPNQSSKPEKIAVHHMRKFRRALSVLLFFSIFVCGTMQITLAKMPESILLDWDQYVIWWIDNLGYSSSSIEYYMKWKSEGFLKAGVTLFMTINTMWLILCVTLFVFGIPLSVELAQNRNKVVSESEFRSWYSIEAILSFIGLLIITAISVEVPWIFYLGPEVETFVVENVRTFSFVWIAFTSVYFATSWGFCFQSMRAIRLISSRS